MGGVAWSCHSRIVQRLAQRAYHLESKNSWWDDWAQYQRNTHPVFGLFLYHPLHPIRFPQRVVILIGSIACGFAITNCVYLGLLEDGAEEIGGLDGAWDAYNATASAVVGAISDVTTVDVDRSAFYLLTIGSFVHSTFDMTIWYLMACFCFRPGGFKINRHCQTVGIYVAVLVVLLAIGGATYFVLLRLDEDVKNQADYEATNSEEFADGIIGDNEAVSRFSFFVGYALELVCALFLFYFITSTVFFTGILGCGRVPILGGRPYEIWREKMAKDDDKKSSRDEIDFPGLQTYGV
ncbi:hypothetical protein ACHAW5_007400 [Stephanodiscus triporus]|uniref:Uncharacterized protein n=1 Tax=Stephanodiscus triporus TaxID=2934178 RepID=A0ABD3QF02_9STRA